MADVQFTVSAQFDRKLFWYRGRSVRHLLARVKADTAVDTSATPRPPLNIALVIDASGSMAGGKLEAAKQAAAGLVDRLQGGDRLTLVSFASDVVVHLDAIAATPANHARILAEVAALETRGATNLSGGWFQGVECAAAVFEADPALTPRVILLSDGQANNGITDSATLGHHASELRQRGVVTSALGIGDGYDEVLLATIAEQGGGRLHDAQHCEDVGQVLLGELDIITATLVEDVRLHVTGPQLAHIELVGNRPHTGGSGGIEVALGGLHQGHERLVLFRVTCPTVEVGTELAFSVQAVGRAVGGGEIRTEAASASLTAAKGSISNIQPRNDALALIVARLWNAEIVAKAVRMNRAGQNCSARQAIERQVHLFRRYVEGLAEAEPMLNALDALCVRIEHSLSPRLSKEMLLGAALSAESRNDLRAVASMSWPMRVARGE